MAFTYFNTDIGYEGQDLHILRNNQPFPLHKFFDSSKTLKYTYRLLGSENIKQYESIKITESGGNIKEVLINAGPYTSLLQEKVECFFVKIEDEDQDVAVILIHLHDSLSSVWASPEKMSLRKGMTIKFGILANFDDGNYADFSYYPDIEVEIVESVNSAQVIKLVNGRLESNNTPTNYPFLLNDVVKISLPRYLKNSDSEISIKGSIEVLEENGVLNLVAGDASNLDNKFNVLCLSDGFNNTSLADQVTYQNYVNQIHSHMLESDVLTPWNLIASSNKINLWSYYTKDSSDIGNNECEFLVITKNGTNYVRDLYTQIVMSDDEYQELPVTLPGNIKVNSINLSNLCNLVGLPSTADLTKTLVDKKFTWKILGWNLIKDANNELKFLKFPGDSDIVNGDKYLTPEVFTEWLKLGKRIYLEKSDTTYGVVNKYTLRSKDVFKPRFELTFSKFKFKTWLDYGKFINNIKSTEYPNLGKLFYDSNGNGIVNIKDIIGEKTIKSKFYNILKVNQTNNIIVLSRNYFSWYEGYNGYETVSLTQGTGTNEINFLYDKRRSIVCLDNNRGVRKSLPFTILNSKKYNLNKINLLSEISLKIKNTFFHEFSHNYLLDEYNNGKVDLSKADIKIQLEETESTEFSNLQTKYDLQEPKPTITNPIGGTIKADNIRWKWPRIKKIGMGMGISKSGIKYTCIIENPIHSNNFNKEEDITILLRKKSVFSKHFRFLIDSIQESNSSSILTLTSLEDFDLDTSYTNNYYLILPYWIDQAQTTYQELIHPITKEWININNRALREESDIDEVQLIEPINQADKTFAKFSSIQIVGLFAGGTSYNGYKKGMYHPTGFCMMRSTEKKRYSSDSNGEDVKNSFCQVCQYILVDFIDPTLHPLIDIPYGNSNSYPTIETNNN